MNRLKEKYQNEVVPSLQKKYNYANQRTTYFNIVNRSKWGWQDDISATISGI